MSMKLYFDGNDALCRTLPHHKELMELNGFTEITLNEAKISRVTGFFFCKAYFEMCESNGSCGKQCEYYIPRNKKSGCCRHWGNLYEPTDKQITIKL